MIELLERAKKDLIGWYADATGKDGSDLAIVKMIDRKLGELKSEQETRIKIKQELDRKAQTVEYSQAQDPENWNVSEESRIRKEALVVECQAVDKLNETFEKHGGCMP